MKASANDHDVNLRFVEKLVLSSRSAKEPLKADLLRKWARILEYDESSFLSTCAKLQKADFAEEEAPSGAWSGLLAWIVAMGEGRYAQKEVLFDGVATQRQREPAKLSDPVTRFENVIVVRGLVRLTRWANWALMEAMGRGRELEGVDWEEYFDQPEHVIVNLRWLGDVRNVVWLILFFQFCRVVYWIGMHL